MKKSLLLSAGLGALVLNLLLAGCATAPRVTPDALVGAWRGPVQFRNGAFAEVKDLEFLYAFNAGGTMTESSNYDGVPPVAPAYGLWRKTGERTFEARYLYYWTKAPANFDDIAKGGGWMPGGHGRLTQKITVGADGNSFDSTIDYEVFDQKGQPTDAPSTATAHGTRIVF